ncbi:MAG: ferritin family protein [Bacteroidota bacterium]
MMFQKLLLPIGIGVAVLLGGCSKEAQAPPIPTVTIENLKVAHACAFKRSLWYASAAKVADRERLGNLAALFRAISKSESVHASLHEQLLVSRNQGTDTSRAACLSLGTIWQALRMASSLERTEVEGLYPPMVSAAQREGWPEAAQQFRHTGSADSGHLALIKEADDRAGTVPLRSYRICTGCGTIVYGQETACPVCSGTAFEAS